jgi:hypothetical protein
MRSVYQLSTTRVFSRHLAEMLLPTGRLIVVATQAFATVNQSGLPGSAATSSLTERYCP